MPYEDFVNHLQEFDKLQADLKAAQAENARLREALGFYADTDNWKHHFLVSEPPSWDAPSDVEIDRGSVAREALQPAEASYE